MSKTLRSWERFGGGISDFSHENPIADAYYFGRSIDVRSEPKHVSILPRTIKESGTVVTDLIKWADVYNTTLDTYLYGNSGNFYKRTSARSYSLLRTVANSHGNGLTYNPEDDFFYYTSDKVIGRYGNMAGTPQFTDDFLGAQGGVPLNTNSVSLVAASSQYGYSADTASLSVTGDIAIEAQIYPTTLPTVGNTMTLVSKWNGSGNIRSYMFDIACVSGYFGSGADGALTISSDTTEAPIDSACTGTSGTTFLTATNASFATDQIILIHQTQGTGAGTWQRNKIAGYTAGTITLETPLNASYTSGAQVRVMKKYSAVTINSGKTYTAKAWNGTVGGILAFLCNGTLTVTGTITAVGKGFRGGGASNTTDGWADYGEGYNRTLGVNGGNNPISNEGGGASKAAGRYAAGSGGGGHATAGSNGVPYDESSPGTGGLIGTDSADGTSMIFGGGAGGTISTSGSLSGANGGGIIFITSADVSITGSITASGANATDPNPYPEGGGSGGGAGGFVLIKGQTLVLGNLLITAIGGTGGRSKINDTKGYGGNGASGRIHLDYYTSYTGTTNPTLNVTQDNNLSTTTTYQLRLSVSNDGTAYETLAREASLQTALWQQVAVSWDASASTATFFLNGVSLGTAVGTKTAIHNNNSEFFVGCNKNDAGTATNFYNGLMDEVRLYNAERTAALFLTGLNTQIAVNTTSLQAYYKFNGDLNDATANANNLTGSGTPTYSSNVPYPSPTTRLDIDQTATTTGNTYTLTTAINEGATHRKTFTPSKDPQKSLSVLIADTGTGNWTLTVHDSLNNTIASKTVAIASLTTGYYEFIFSSVWRPLTNFTNEYHFHLTSSVAGGTVTSTTTNDLETVSYRTYFQFLVEDIEWHAAGKFLNFIFFLNERYLATYDATLYDPNKLVFSAGWRARCYGYWQEYLAIGCMKGANIYDYDQGRIYFWDGYSPTFNFYIDVPEGGVNALLGTRGQLYIWAGWHGDLLVYEGGSSAKKLKEIPLLDPAEYAEVYPQAVAMWQANPRFGVAGNSNSSDINKAVYTWGSKNYNYPDTLTCDFPISTGNYGSTVKIGAILPFNKELLISWQDNVAYGVDYVNVSNNPYPTAYLEMMVEDLDVSYKEKQATQLVATFDPLNSGESINVKYMNEETDTTWNLNSDSPTTDDITIRKIISNGRYFHMKVGVDLTTSTTTSPVLKSIVLETEDNRGENRIG
jgi:hypothetical protein